MRALAPGAHRPRGAAHSVVLEWVEARLRDGELSVGDKLPAERALAELFEISRASVR
ncbi:MAG: GntR family transcriptional regulator, partial [Micrococcales bacterium]|nr:GntR family transcriptional regulator [Micrococcales bacterium]